MSVDISGLNRADVLCALYNASRPQGMGFMHYTPQEMQCEEAEQLLSQTKYFDYLKGRVMKVDLSSDTEFREALYDRDNGQGAAQRVIDSLRANDSGAIQKQHKENVEQSAALTMNRINQETRTTDCEIGGVKGKDITLGLASMKDKLLPKVQEAKKAVS